MEVEDVEGVFIFGGKVVGGVECEVDYFVVGDDGGEVI